MSLVRTATVFLAACSAISALPEVKRDIYANCTSVEQRVPWASLTQDEKAAYINADLCLFNSPSKSGVPGALTRWDDLHWPHVLQTTYIHGVGAFLPWHRYYMKVHEILQRTECGYTGRMPYWNEIADMDDMTVDEMFTNQYFGGNGTGPNGCIVDGPFVNFSLAFTPKVDNGCIYRNFSQIKLLQGTQANIDQCNAVTNYTAAWHCWANLPHAAGHGGIGGIMGDPTYSPGDPLFYLHHSYLDKLWWEWQKEDYPARLTDMGGPNLPAETPPGTVYPGPSVTEYFGDNGNVTTLNHVLWMTGLQPNVTIHDVMNLNGPLICYEYLDS